MIDDVRLQPKTTTALEIAVLVQSIPLAQGADLIEQYAKTAASAARLDATEQFFNRFNVEAESPLSRRP